MPQKDLIQEQGYEAKYNEELNAYYPINERTREIPLNWESKLVANKFIDIIKFWDNLGVSGFVFKDFEYIEDKTKTIVMGEATLKELRRFYNAIKEVNDDIYVIGKSNIIEINNIDQYTDGITKVFDYFQTEKVSKIGTNDKYGNDVIGKFSPRKLASVISMIGNNNANILSFGSENNGRFVSRWGDDGQFHVESAKAFALLNHLLPSSSTIYYGDELGARNIGLTHLDDFQDEALELRKQNLREMKISEKEFMDAQVLQGPINGRSLMMWNANKNGGFSVSNKTVTPSSVGYKTNNVEIQYKDQDSVFNFYRKLFKLIKTPQNGLIIKKGEYKVSSMVSVGGVIKTSIRHNNKEIITFVNVSQSDRKIIRIPKEGKVILSTYAFKEYDQLPKKLQPFEGIVISKFTDELIKSTQAIKVQKEKEEQNIIDAKAMSLKEKGNKQTQQSSNEAKMKAKETTDKQVHLEIEEPKKEKPMLKEERELGKTELIEQINHEKLENEGEELRQKEEKKPEKFAREEVNKLDDTKNQFKLMADEAAKVEQPH